MHLVKLWFNKPERERTIHNQVRKNNSIIYGGRSIMKQLPFFMRRPTEDYDIYTKKPKKNAVELEKKLDRQAGMDYFYVKPALYPGTFKVMNRGKDLKDPRDDVGVADFTKMPVPKPKTKRIEGIRYSLLSQEKKNKLKALRDPEYKFRHEKDRGDYKRMVEKKEYMRQPKIRW